MLGLYYGAWDFKILTLKQCVIDPLLHVLCRKILVLYYRGYDCLWSFQNVSCGIVLSFNVFLLQPFRFLEIPCIDSNSSGLWSSLTAKMFLIFLDYKALVESSTVVLL